VIKKQSKPSNFKFKSLLDICVLPPFPWSWLFLNFEFIETGIFFIFKVISHRKAELKKKSEMKVTWKHIIQKIPDWILDLSKGMGFHCYFPSTGGSNLRLFVQLNRNNSKLPVFTRESNISDSSLPSLARHRLCLHSIFLAEAVSFYPPPGPAPIWEPKGIFITESSLR